MIEKSFTDAAGQTFSLVFGDDWQLKEIYSHEHQVDGEVYDAGMGHFGVSWPSEVHETMRIIPCIGGDGTKYFIVHYFTPETIFIWQ
jgi:hypothetical protein